VDAGVPACFQDTASSLTHVATSEMSVSQDGLEMSLELGCEVERGAGCKTTISFSPHQGLVPGYMELQPHSPPPSILSRPRNRPRKDSFPTWQMRGLAHLPSLKTISSAPTMYPCAGREAQTGHSSHGYHLILIRVTLVGTLGSLLRSLLSRALLS
jgi:hypothetical protein